MRGPLPKAEFDWIFARVPRLTVEVVIAEPGRGVLLSLRGIDPCKGMWHLPGGTVRFGEPAVDAVKRVAHAELGLTVDVGELLGYIEYPSHYEHGLDSPVGLAFATQIAEPHELPSACRWFTDLPANMHDEQKAFLHAHAASALRQARR
ncbi:MAG: NUDIX hydrolase [Solirubrobacteraceae bacterium]